MSDPFNQQDPFADAVGGSSAPVFSFAEVGAEITGTVASIEQRDDTFPDGTPRLWSDGKPMAVYIFTLDTVTGQHRIFVRGNMVTAIKEASGGRSTIGRVLTVKHHALGDKKPGRFPAKLYKAKVEDPTPTAAAAPKDLW